MPASDQGIQPGGYRIVPRVLCFITYAGREVLLLKGAPAKRIWPNQYNGVGGHVEPGEDFHSAAVREVAEETGLTVPALQFCGAIHIDAGGSAGVGLFVFKGETDRRDTRPSGEGTLEWIPHDRIDRLDLVEDLATLLPRVLAMAPGAPPFFGRYRYDAAGRLQMTLG